MSVSCGPELESAKHDEDALDAPKTQIRNWMDFGYYGIWLCLGHVRAVSSACAFLLLRGVTEWEIQSLAQWDLSPCGIWKISVCILPNFDFYFNFRRCNKVKKCKFSIGTRTLGFTSLWDLQPVNVNTNCLVKRVLCSHLWVGPPSDITHTTLSLCEVISDRYVRQDEPSTP